MAMGTRKGRERQSDIWIATRAIVETPGNAFYGRLNRILSEHKFDARVEALCRKFYKRSSYGRPSLAPGVYFRALLIGYFEGLLTSCDPFLTSADRAESSPTGLPCPPIVTHADGSPVSVKNPARAGEELVAYAVGLGQTTPPSVTGQLVTKSAPTQTTFTLDFNYHPNALPSRPLPTGPQPIFAGTTQGYAGLYQVNFVVPPAPAGTLPCVDASTLPAGSNVVQSKLTVSIGGAFSFDGARICVAIPNQ